ncbi:MAG TPA: dipeptide epimerase [Phnomibacter sp.]|nr:dipeptide epimerase [Phnomibacter sp.]
MTIEQIDIYRYSIPMVPFTIATGTMHYAQNMLVHVHTNEGITGMGECSAFPMIAGETQETCLVLAKDFAAIWKEKNAADIAARLQELDSYIAGNHTAKSAFDMALYDLAAKRAGQPLYQYLGGNYFEPESDLTIGIGTTQTMAEQAIDFVQNKQAHILKVKLGKDPAEDIQRIAAIRKAVGPGIGLRIDANQGWNFEAAVQALTGMEQQGIEFCEQPMPKYLDTQLPSLRSRTKIPIMADESVFNHHDAERLIQNNACDSINIKLSKAGGIQEALRIHEVSKNAGIPNMLGGMLESRLALSAKVHLALSCSNIKYYDLDTCLLGHLQDPVLDGVQFDGMKLKLPQLPGIGASVDPTFLAQCDKYSV